MKQKWHLNYKKKNLNKIKYKNKKTQKKSYNIKSKHN